MLVYEKNKKLNIVMKDNLPPPSGESPDVVIEQIQDEGVDKTQITITGPVVSGDEKILSVVGNPEDVPSTVSNLDNLKIGDEYFKTWGSEIPQMIDRLDALSNIGRYLSTWDCTTGLPETNPMSLPYEYHNGDYFIISKIGLTNYKPDGSTYTGDPSTTTETNDLVVMDMYRYDGTEWTLLTFNLALQQYVKKSEVTHETWIFTLKDGSPSTKEVMLWNSQN